MLDGSTAVLSARAMGKTKYDLEEANDIIKRAAETFEPDKIGRHDALLALVDELTSLSTSALTIKPRSREDGFVIANAGKDVVFFIDGGELKIQSKAGGQAKPIKGLEYNPMTKLFEGEAAKEDTGWPKKRRSAAAVVAGQLVAALTGKGLSMFDVT